jgi:hypothetical protein
MFEDAAHFTALKSLKKRLNDAKVCAEKKATGVDSSYEDDDLEAVVLKDMKHWKHVAL